MFDDLAAGDEFGSAQQQKSFGESEFLGGERKQSLAPSCAAPVAIQGEIPHSAALALAGMKASPDQGSELGPAKLGQDERFGEIVVGSASRPSTLCSTRPRAVSIRIGASTPRWRSSRQNLDPA